MGHEDFKDRPVLDQEEPSITAKNYGVFVCFLTHFLKANTQIIYWFTIMAVGILEEVPESSEGREESCYLSLFYILLYHLHIIALILP